jgi:hypothetical protein
MNQQLFNDYKKQVDELDKQLESYLEDYQDLMLLEHVKLKDALKNQVELQLVFETVYSKARKLQSFIEEEVENAYAEAIKNETNKNYRDVSISEARESAKTDTIYRKYRRLNIEATGLVHDSKAALETVTTRRYVMNNMTNAITSATENTIL